MEDEWKKFRLGEAPIDILDGDRGKNYPTLSEFSKNGYCLFLSAKNVKKSGFDFSDKYFISEKRDNLLGNGKLERYDLVLTTRGTVGNLAYYGDNIPFENMRINSGMVIIRAKRQVLNERFLYLILRSKAFEDQVLSNQTGSAQPQLPIRDLKTLEITIPPFNEQLAIASILSALDDKIELNLQMNKTLEEMAMTLYKHWFVDFGPFKVQEFVHSELGEIPKGWEVMSIGDVTSILNSKRVPLSTMQRSTRKGPYPYYGASGIIDSIDDYKFDGEYVIISEDGENLRSRNTPIAFRAVGQFWVNNHAHILQGNVAGINELVICHFAQLDMSPYLTGAVQPKLNKENLLLIKVPLPIDFSVIQPVLSQLDSLARILIMNEAENQTLTTLRDTLLPKLISGEVRVKDAARSLAEVL